MNQRLPVENHRGAASTHPKILDLDAVAQALKRSRGSSKKIVHCHGVFDLLHIGHIRYFQQAKKWGDVLVVTVTPDKFVNKGPHRPVFNETLRAEAIAALDCVDYVAINRWPTAVETIGLLRPDYYVKGPDYKSAKDDVTGGIEREAAAVKAAGGKIRFTDDITFSSTQILNDKMPVFSKEVGNFLAQFKRRYDLTDILGYVEGAKKLKILTIGEAIIDEYEYCEAIGKSSKEPTLVVKLQDLEIFAGGILAVGNNAANFCDRVRLLTFLGAEDSRETFIRKSLKKNVDAKFLYRKDAPTIVKRRYVESYFFTKLLETYRINDSLMDDSDSSRLVEALEREIPKYDVVLVVDYGHGMMTKPAIDLVCRKAKFLAVNAQANAGNVGYHTVGHYSRADLVCLAENEVRMEARDRRGDLRRLVLQFAKSRKFDRLIVTRGKNGCLCYDNDKGFQDVPAVAGQVVDRIGAGDAFLSLAALCAAQKAPLEVTGLIGNVAGAQAVATVGHRTSVDKTAVLKHITSLLK